MLHENSAHKIKKYLTKCKFERRLFTIILLVTTTMQCWLNIGVIGKTNYNYSWNWPKKL